MSFAIQLLIAFICGAVFYRLRGGWLNQLMGWGQRSTLSKLAWAIPTALLMTESSNGPWYLWPLLSVSVFGGQALFGTGQYLRDVEPTYPDLLGFYRNALAALPVFYFSPLLFASYALLGSCHAFLYWLGFRFRKTDADLGDVILGGFSWVLIVALK